MANAITLDRVHEKSAAEARNFAIDFTGVLEETETISTITVTEVTTSVLTITTPAVNTISMTVDGAECKTGKGVTFRVSGGVAGTVYTLLASITTTASQTITRYFKLRVVAVG